MGKSQYKFGFLIEEKAVFFLQNLGFLILERNFHSRFGEIDIIAKKGEILHFFEVKATNKNYETIYRINKNKLDKILKTIEIYLQKYEICVNYQIDAILFEKDKFEIIENITL